MVRNLISPAQRRALASQSAREDADHDVLLAEAFLRASRFGGAEVVAVNERLLMTTSKAAAYVNAIDQASLWRWARVRRIAGPAVLRLNGRSPMAAKCEPVVDGPVLAGMLVKLDGPSPETTRVSCPPENSFSWELPGTSRQACTLRAQLSQAAASGVNSVISGEAGTGKTTVARRLLDHDDSGYDIHEFDAADVATQGWVQHIADALRQHRVLLTHLDELPTGVLSTVLAAIGASDPSCRVAATVGGSTLAAAIQRHFPVHVRLPPLRDRLEDLPAIATRVLARHTRGGAVKRLDPGVRRQLWSYHWPGNVAELEQVLHRAALLAPTSVVDESCVRMPSGKTAGPGARRWSMVEAAEIDTLLDALDRCAGNKLAAAAMLGISRSTLYRKVQALGVSTT